LQQIFDKFHVFIFDKFHVNAVNNLTNIDSNKTKLFMGTLPTDSGVATEGDRTSPLWQV